MLPPERVTRAARRWLDLLQRSSANQAWGLLQANTAYSDLPPSAYLQALDWLRSLGFLEPIGADSRLSPNVAELPPGPRHQLLYARGLVYDAPLWLPDADSLITGPDELPDDAAAFAEQLSLSDTQALAGVSQARGKVNAEITAEIGLRGERALCAALEVAWPGSTCHLATFDDGWGYDIAFTPAPDEQWHLEVKTTTRRGRMSAYLSRNEHAVAAADPFWRAVAVGIDSDGALAAVATVKLGVLAERAPQDTSPAARWASTRYDLRAADLDRGLPFLPHPLPPEAAGLDAGFDSRNRYAWMPT